jgi:hypothetical protein
MTTVLPPTAGPAPGDSPVTVGQPEDDPDRRDSSAGALGLPHPVARSYPGPAEKDAVEDGSAGFRLLPDVTSWNAEEAPAE